MKNLLKKLSFSFLLSISSLYAQESAWSYQGELYMLAPWIEGDTSLGYHRTNFAGDSSIENVPVDMSPKTIIDNLNSGLMAHFEAHHNSGWGAWLDYVYMDLAKDKSQITELGMYQGIFEAFATYRVPLGNSYIDYIGGVRWWHMVMDLTIAGINKNRTFDWYDPIIGAVWINPLNKKWDLRLRGDIGGFGLASKFTSAIEVGALYHISESWEVDMHLKALWVNYEQNSIGEYNRFVYDTVSYGPVVGITYKF